MAPVSEDDSVLRRLEALEKATEKRLDDARDIHRREHEAADYAHRELHETAKESGRQLQYLQEQRFESEKEQRDQARVAMDRRLEGMNEIRSQLNSQATTFETIAAAQAVEKGINARIDELRERLVERIVTIEKGDVKQEGRGLGQSATVGIIVGAIGLAATIISIVVVVSNFATGT